LVMTNAFFGKKPTSRLVVFLVFFAVLLAMSQMVLTHYCKRCKTCFASSLHSGQDVLSLVVFRI
jgi:hypothetical protein